MTQRKITKHAAQRLAARGGKITSQHCQGHTQIDGIDRSETRQACPVTAWGWNGSIDWLQLIKECGGSELYHRARGCALPLFLFFLSFSSLRSRSSFSSWFLDQPLEGPPRRWNRSYYSGSDHDTIRGVFSLYFRGIFDHIWLVTEARSSLGRGRRVHVRVSKILYHDPN